MKTIRFAPLIRVSTETQQKQGESLRTQKKQISEYVKNLNGTISDNCWKYSGQEHGSRDMKERNLLNYWLIQVKGSLTQLSFVMHPGGAVTMRKAKPG